jgi:hypothetical protein
MSAILCEYRVQARRPGTYLALGVGMSASFLAATQSASPVISVLVAAYLGLVLWRLVHNPQTGFRLREDRIETLSKGRLRVIPIGRIESFRLSLPRLAPALCLLTLQSGEVTAVPCGSASRARALAAALQAQGVPSA